MIRPITREATVSSLRAGTNQRGRSHTKSHTKLVHRYGIGRPNHEVNARLAMMTIKAAVTGWGRRMRPSLRSITRQVERPAGVNRYQRPGVGGRARKESAPEAIKRPRYPCGLPGRKAVVDQVSGETFSRFPDRDDLRSYWRFHANAPILVQRDLD
jgi:hypothetical protein